MAAPSVPATFPPNVPRTARAVSAPGHGPGDVCCRVAAISSIGTAPFSGAVGTGSAISIAVGAARAASSLANQTVTLFMATARPVELRRSRRRG
jgi:hypothetical protein